MMFIDSKFIFKFFSRFKWICWFSRRSERGGKRWMDIGESEISSTNAIKIMNIKIYWNCIEIKRFNQIEMQWLRQLLRPNGNVFIASIYHISGTFIRSLWPLFQTFFISTHISKLNFTSNGPHLIVVTISISIFIKSKSGCVINWSLKNGSKRIELNRMKSAKNK